MKQLKMYWKPVETAWPKLQDGWSWRCYNGTQADALAWMDICRDGLLAPSHTVEFFDECILNRPDFRDNALFFVERDGMPVASVCALLDENGVGTMHMVGSLPAARGGGVGRILCQLVQASLWERGCKVCYLTTDEFRVPAIKSYLNAGYLPVDYDVEMDYRWDILLRFLGHTNVPLVKEDGSFVKLLNEYAPTAE